MKIDIEGDKKDGDMKRFIVPHSTHTPIIRNPHQKHIPLSFSMFAHNIVPKRTAFHKNVISLWQFSRNYIKTILGEINNKSFWVLYYRALVSFFFDFFLFFDD